MIKSLEWNDYFNNRFENEISAHTDQNTIVLCFAGRHYIHNVLFFGMKTNSILYKLAAQSDILIENSRFLLNTDTICAQGGNILISSKGSFIQSKICCMNCSSCSQGMHSSVFISDGYSSKSIVEQCSFVKLGSEGNSILNNGLDSGKFNKINITNCQIQRCSCIRINSINGNTVISSSNFKNNTSKNDGIFLFRMEWSPYRIYKILNCNIIEQICLEHFYGLIYVYGYLTIDACIIKENFINQSCLFYASASSHTEITVTNSYLNNPRINSISNDQTLVKSISSKTNEKDIQNDFDIILNCIQRKYLQINLAEYDTFVNNKGVSLTFYISSVYLTALHSTS